MSGAPLLAVRGLEVTLSTAAGGVRPVDGASLTIERGQIVALVGTSGSGKSMTALALMRLLPDNGMVTGGAIDLDGVDLLTLPEVRMRAIRGRRMAFIGQDAAAGLDPVLTIGVQIVEAIELHTALRGAAARASAIAWLHRVGMTEPHRRFDDHPHTLSGGQKQRAAIAMALVGRPDVLIADEPTRALDVIVQAQILALLASLQREHRMAVLLISHDLQAVSRIADRVALMSAGRVVEEAPTSAFFDRPQHLQTRLLLQALQHVGHAEAPLAPERPKPTAGGVLLEVRDLTVRYPARGILGWRAVAVVAADAVSLTVEAGQTLALVGPSGCGKSTVGKAIVQLLRRQAHVDGAVVLGGHDLCRLTGERLRRARSAVQMVFQDPYASLDPRMTVDLLVAEGLQALHPELDAAGRQARVSRLLDQVGLSRRLGGRRPDALSGGQRQRVAIARALAVEPRLIVLDEPTSALDAVAQTQILQLLHELQRDTGAAYLLITHDVRTVHHIAHRIAVMQVGRIEEIGTVASVLHSPEARITRELLDASR